MDQDVQAVAEGQPVALVLANRLIRNRKVQVTMGFWVIGMLLALFATSPVTLTRETEEAYFSTMKSAHDIPTYELEEQVLTLEAYVYDAKSWFWRFDDKARAEVNRRQELLDDARGKLNVVYQEKRELMAQAKGYVGVWSQFSIDEAHYLFWDGFERAKQFAKRMTFYDAMFSLFSSREESLVGFVLRWIYQIVMNITIGLIACIFSFTWGLGWMIWDYSPSAISGIGFFIVAMLGCLSFIFSVVLAVYGTAIFAGYVFVKQASHSIEAGEGGPGMQRRYVRYGAGDRGRYYQSQRPNMQDPYSQRSHYE